MDQKEKETIRREVKTSLSEIENDIIYLKDVTKPVSPENAIGRISRMDAIHNMNINKSLLRSKEEQKHNLERVLERIEDKEFGICVKCGKDIPYKRIIRIPDSKLCVPCIRELKK